ncbi:hypothetical protein C8J56DRAFT_928785 [Mycena floridula]|nr:hypothetical protein C8J56DRAFT_928785 [Mycena floridula]
MVQPISSREPTPTESVVGERDEAPPAGNTGKGKKGQTLKKKPSISSSSQRFPEAWKNSQRKVGAAVDELFELVDGLDDRVGTLGRELSEEVDKLRARLDEGGFPAPAETGVAGKAPMMDKESTEVLNEAKKLTVKVAANVARLNRLRVSNNKLVDEVHTLREAIEESKASYTALEKDHRSLLKDHSALQKAHDSLRESSLEKNKALEKRVDTMDSTQLWLPCPHLRRRRG